MAATSGGSPLVLETTRRPGQTVPEPEVIAHVAARLARYTVPVRVFTLEAFPTTPSANGSRVQKNRLRETAEALLGQG